MLTAEQVSQLSPAAALSVTSEQRDMLPEDSRKALDKVLEDSVTAKSGAAQGTWMWCNCHLKKKKRAIHHVVI